MRFRERSCLHNIKVQGVAVGADVGATESYPDEQAEIVDKG